ncbi:MAG: right-handed parallel beta-helix repeat-containing protein [Kiritimatiellae bacterium]|nr:right-handed parallel beta-helix repeat-containing protein [Kiritimatiellia bacterium]
MKTCMLFQFPRRFLSLALLAAGTAVASAAEEAVVASSFGFDPADSTKFLQKALDSGARKIVIDRQVSPWITRPLFARSNCEIVFERGAEVVAKKGAFLGKGDSLITLKRAENVKLSGYGATLRMHRADYAAPPYAKAEWRMSINLLSCSNVVVEGLTLLESGGDGVYVGVAGKNGPCQDIVLRDLVCDRQYRQGISVISARNLLIERCVLRNTGGTPPAAGIDFEPNHANEELSGIVMRDCTVTDNQGVGLDFYLGQLDGTTKPVSIKVVNCRMSGNSHGFALSNGRKETFVKGFVSCENCTFENERGFAVRIRRKPVNSVSVTFDRCQFLNCQTNATAPAAVTDMFLGNTAPGAGPTDGVTFRNCTLRQPVARDWLPRKLDSLATEVPSNISGTLTIVTPSGTSTCPLDAAWRGSHFGKPILAGAPARRMFDPAAARPFDARPGELVRLKPFRFRNGVTYRFFMAAPGEARFSGRFTKVGKPAFTPKPLIVKDAAGKTCAKISLQDLAETPFSFKAKTAGFYTMTADVGSHAFGLSATSVPIAVVPSGLARTVFATQGTLYFRATPETPFIVAVAGADMSERVRTQVADPADKVLWEADQIGEWTAYRSDAHPADGLWRITFNRAKGYPFEDYSVLQQGAAPDFFLTPEKCW